MDTLTTRTTGTTTDSPVPMLAAAASIGLVRRRAGARQHGTRGSRGSGDPEDVVDGVMLMAYPLVGALLLRRGLPPPSGGCSWRSGW